MSKQLFFGLLFLCSSFYSFAQKGEVWSTISRQEFQMDDEGNLTNQYEVEDYATYYLFINNNEFLHCTPTVTSLYKILSRDAKQDFVDYKVISEADNIYTFRFNKKSKTIIIYSQKGYGIIIGCAAPYATKVFDNLNNDK